MTYLKGFTNIGDSTVTNHIRENLISYFDYGLVEKSNFINVQIPQTGYYGGLDHRLRLINDPRYSSGQVWQAVRGNWVWESGLGALTSNNPSYPGISGVYVNNTFYPVSTTGNYSHHINHYLGRVIFDNPIPSGSIVECQYSYKYISVTKCDGINWFTQIQKNSERSDSTNFISQDGDYSILSDNRYQLPSIGIEVGKTRKMKPFQIGGGQIVYTDFYLHCISEDAYTRDNLVDIVCLQNEKVINAYDLNKISASGAFPLDYRGVPASGAKQYPELVTEFPGDQIRIINSSFDSIYSLTPDIHVGTVKIVTECILFGV
jgi:hypothetical protein